MKRGAHVIVALIVALAAILYARPSLATNYADNPNPACKLMRNVVPGAPYLPEPNRADARRAMALAGDDRNLFGNTAGAQYQYTQALPLMQKIDAEDTTALSELPPSTPRIDLVIDRHIINLAWARAMLGIFYEQGRATAADPQQAAAFFQKSIDTQFVDDRGCVHDTQPAYATLTHLAGMLIYGVGIPEDRARARTLLLRAGEKAASIVYLLDHNALPSDYRAYLNTNFDDLAYAVKNPPVTPEDEMLALLGRILFWCVVVAVLFVGAVGLVRVIRRRQGYKDEASLYRSVFAAYDVVHGLIARFGLVAEGLIGCFVGLSILFGGFAMGNFQFINMGVPYNLLVTFAGLTALLGGLSKLIEAARVSARRSEGLVHGAARPASEADAQAAARGTSKALDLHDRTFKE